MIFLAITFFWKNHCKSKHKYHCYKTSCKWIHTNILPWIANILAQVRNFVKSYVFRQMNTALRQTFQFGRCNLYLSIDAMRLWLDVYNLTIWTPKHDHHLEHVIDSC